MENAGSEPLAELELELLAEEEEWRRRRGDGPQSGVREPRKSPPGTGAAAAAVEVPDHDLRSSD